jgi:hypothetical protein
MEDLFYCAYSAVRSAVYGGAASVPERFDPMVNGLVIQERRHALTWMVSPGVAWQETDRSTSISRIRQPHPQDSENGNCTLGLRAVQRESLPPRPNEPPFEGRYPCP